MIQRRYPLKRTALKPRQKPLKRTALKRKPTRKLPGYSDPEYLAWLKQWPCYVCLMQAVARLKTSPLEAVQRGVRAGFRDTTTMFELPCAVVDVAHIGVRGRGQRCKDRDTMPLGAWHHREKTCPGGGPESHHSLGKKFWAFHGLDREEVIATLNRLYEEETGR